MDNSAFPDKLLQGPEKMSKRHDCHQLSLSINTNVIRDTRLIDTCLLACSERSFSK